jgi:hypothetical protein
MDDIERGDLVFAVDVMGVELAKRALSGIVHGKSFPVVWVCREEEWDAAEREGREPDGVPWPAEDVKARSDALK